MGGLFSGSSSRRVGAWAYQQAQEAGAKAQTQLDQGQTSALNSISEGRTQGLSSLGQGYDTARTEYQGASDRYQPWTDAGTKALSTYQDSLGQNGAEGNANAVAQFQASPGYQYQVDQATDAVARKASALGALGSGNTQAAITDRASQLANQEYGGWQDRLNGLSNTGLQATNAQADLQKGLGDLGVSQGRDEANIYTTTGAQDAGIYSNFANLGSQNTWNTSNAGSNAILTGVKNGQNQVMSGLNFGVNAAGSGLKLLGLGF